MPHSSIWVKGLVRLPCLPACSIIGAGNYWQGNGDKHSISIGFALNYTGDLMGATKIDAGS